MPQKSINRRGFISKSVNGLAGAGLMAVTGGMAGAQTDEKRNGKPERRDPIYRKLGRTGIELPVVGMGVMNAEIPNIVQLSYEKGIRLFDTAAAYQGGRNEAMVGQVIRKLGVRDKVVIATKVLAPRERADLSPEEAGNRLIEIFNKSLKQLDMDYVDVLYLHSVSTADDIANPGIKDAFRKLKERKKIRFAGVSSHMGQEKVLRAAVQDGFYDVALVAINVAMSADAGLTQAVKAASLRGIGVVAMKTQAGGRWWRHLEGGYEGPLNQTASLKWALNLEGVSMAIPGHTTPDQLEQNFSVAYDLDYSEEELEFFKDAAVMLGANFCRQCRECLASCPNGAEIPELMRVHMYAAQYGNFGHARYTYDDIAPARRLESCRECRTCTARCSRFIDIPSRIEELKSIYV